MPASGTLLRALLRSIARRRSAAPAEPVTAVPLGDLEGPSGEREQRIRNLQEQRAHSAPLPTVRLGRVRGDADRKAIDAFELAQVVPDTVHRERDHVPQ